MNQPVTPESVLSNDDPGDDTQRRFRYQATYAAIISLSLLDEKSEADYIFCEHHEDILVKHKDGTFVGIQVKTRIAHKGPYKAGDKEIIKSLKRFIELESQFRGDFSKYVIAVNNGFWQETENSSNLLYLLRLAKASISKEGVTPDKCLSSLAKKISFDDETIKPLVLNPDGTINNLALKVLSKVRTDDDLPGLNDVETRLLEVLSQFPGIRQRRVDQVQQLAQKLVSEMFRAASFANSPPQSLYYSLRTDSAAHRTNSIIQGKRITKETILQIFLNYPTTPLTPSIQNQSDLLANYPKLTAELRMSNKQFLPTFRLVNESDQISANQIQITISIARSDKKESEPGKWFCYYDMKLERLKPGEAFPSCIESNRDDILKWCKQRGYKNSLNPSKSLERQEILKQLSLAHSQDVRITVMYSSNMFGANKICTISKNYRLESCRDPEALDPRDEFYWKEPKQIGDQSVSLDE